MSELVSVPLLLSSFAHTVSPAWDVAWSLLLPSSQMFAGILGHEAGTEVESVGEGVVGTEPISVWTQSLTGLHR